MKNGKGEKWIKSVLKKKKMGAFKRRDVKGVEQKNEPFREIKQNHLPKDSKPKGMKVNG